MEKLNYYPNSAARTLKTNQSYKIGLILKGSDEQIRLNPFYINVLLGISQQCNQRGYGTQTTVSNNIEDLVNEVNIMMKQQIVDAFVLLYSKEHDPIKQLLSSEGLPFVVLGKPVNDEDLTIPHIDNDNILASKRLTEHVISQDINEIIYICEPAHFEVFKDRKLGFETTVMNRQIKHQIVELDINRDEIMTYFKANSARLKRNKLAVITSDAMLHLVVLSVLYELNISIPNDVITATFNDSYLTANASPPQTTIDIQPQELGKLAGIAVLNMINDTPQSMAQYTLVDTKLNIRQSTQR
ncbi:maltose operon transcriptional repressor [Staphylococcus simiae CCM 7213 = CCUG 51256]|uniref:Maltose operon transcriptional repressor n=1 Tax=Staphylococcus simiae CCM 7213 = CCUG 51256 TaxID=911238 RepID=G5JFD0_9STAP|nr:substrate-binding domain-containing protein [Staphylococcus simiae]EHJ09101.1 maltose operon transcriptional repressor [Staphylococcus simiae CCM 7213 = CCUG 51256]